MITVQQALPSNEVLLEQCFELHQASQPYPWSQRVFMDMRSEPYSIFVALDENDALAGYALILSVADEVTLMDIAVSRSWRKRGVGTRLLDAIFQSCEITNKANVFLEVRENNLPARQLYKKYGFEQVAIRKNYYPGISPSTLRENAVIMEKRF